MTTKTAATELGPAARRFRTIALLEGASFLLLLLVAMPLKYGLGMSVFVKIFGWAHGVLFVGYVLTAFGVWVEREWSVVKLALAFLAALLPFGPFVLDRKLLR